MPGITEARLLDAWEAALPCPRRARALLLAALVDDGDGQDLADRPVGEVDRLLLELREQCFGPLLECLVVCPECGEELDASVDVAELRFPVGEERVRRVSIGGRPVLVRPVTTRDLLLTGDRASVLRRCVVSATEPGDRGGARGGDLDGPHDGEHDGEHGGDRGGGLVDDGAEEEGLALVETVLDQLDPQAAPTVELDCPACRASWNAPFDVADFVWLEVDRTARRALYDVHVLAGAYGWRERDVLALSPVRRGYYLQAVGA